MKTWKWFNEIHPMQLLSILRKFVWYHFGTMLHPPPTKFADIFKTLVLSEYYSDFNSEKCTESTCHISLQWISWVIWSHYALEFGEMWVPKRNSHHNMVRVNPYVGLSQYQHWRLGPSSYYISILLTYLFQQHNFPPLELLSRYLLTGTWNCAFISRAGFAR